MNTMPWTSAALGAAALLLLGAGPPAAAADPAFQLELPAGLACDFPLTITGFGAGPQVFRTFIDRDDQVRTITAGTGNALTFTNTANGETLSTPANGGATRTQSRADGTTRLELTGHNVVILFPTDDPAGPSTTVHSGRVVLDVGADGSTFTVRSVTGATLDVCAALSG